MVVVETKMVVKRVSTQFCVDSETEVDVSRLVVGVTVAWVDEPEIDDAPGVVVATGLADKVDETDESEGSGLVAIMTVDMGDETNESDVVRSLLKVTVSFGGNEALPLTDEKPVQVSGMYVGVFEKKTLPVDSPSPPPPGDPGAGQESLSPRAFRFGKPSTFLHL